MAGSSRIKSGHDDFKSHNAPCTLLYVPMGDFPAQPRLLLGCQRQGVLLAVAVEQSLQSDQADFSPNLGSLTASQLIDSKIPRSAHESGRLGREVARTTPRHRANLWSFAAANHLLAALSPRLDQVRQH